MVQVLRDEPASADGRGKGGSMASTRTDHEILHSAARSLGRVGIGGPRAVTMLSLNQIEDLLLALVIMGLPALQPGQVLDFRQLDQRADGKAGVV